MNRRSFILSGASAAAFAAATNAQPATVDEVRPVHKDVFAESPASDETKAPQSMIVYHHTLFRHGRRSARVGPTRSALEKGKAGTENPAQCALLHWNRN